MSWRTVIISNQAKLDYKMGFMVIRGTQTHRIYVDEIATLLIENPAISLTGCLLEVLIEKKVKIIFCDSKRNPMAELLPYHGSHDSSSKIRTQISWSHDAKGIIWREIVIDKIRKQAELLFDMKRVEAGNLVLSYTNQVEIADLTNREGHAAKVYFNALFGMDFTRSADIPTNAALNYGYSLLLSAVNREISVNGYITQLGIFHDNMFNHFNLGSDLMEPFRVVVDRYLIANLPSEFGTNEKHQLWTILDKTVVIDGTKQALLNAIKIYTRSVFDAINDQDPSKIKFYSLVDNESGRIEI